MLQRFPGKVLYAHPVMFDTHAHVHDPAYDQDRALMLARAQEAGVTRIVTVGCDLNDTQRAFAVLREYAQYPIEASIGIHPHAAKDAPEEIAAAFDSLLASAPRPPIAVGEIGLDYYYDNSPRDSQKRVFIEQLRYARGHALPLIFHTRDAHDDFTEILRTEFTAPMRGIVHCFTGDARQARTYVDEFGLLLGIGGVLTFKSAQPLREAVREVGLEHIVLETDCPYLAPVPHRGQRNEPAYMTATAAKLAEILSLEADEIIARTTATATKFFHV